MRQQGQNSGAQRPQHRLHQHHSLPDLVRDSKLDTRFLPDGATQHTFYVTPPHASRRQRARVDEVWRRERKLGKGGYGDVWLERCDSGPSTGTLRAVKEMLIKPLMDYSRELEAMTKFSHEKYVDCFVKCHGWYMSEHTVFIAMEYLEHGDLNGYLYQPLPEDQVKTIVLQLVEGLVHMHDNGFAHRDLKPLNILVHKPGPDWWVKIGDFGISKRSEEDNTALRTTIGTDGYMAPELKGLIYSQGSSESNEFSYTFAVDMWALGELTFRMATRRPAFPDPNDLVNYVLRGQPFPLPALEVIGASSDCCDFINKSMIADPGNRLTASEACRHPWLQLSRPSSRASSASPKT
ncbi:kinase-like domain-containing protein [Ilyonectria robusta]|uniref:kinase-like domain-containing protein n=1 Tax=Ilyonectria robusta TaxID=1079257 RepID=UPI001E8EBE9B|nr:kinase-like domain-containing protein [Ilyonectria robusta]KAH8737297.1 kinase-like domain-containing protein [Ilyonectria robusta]